jgi:hypothetical protein
MHTLLYIFICCAIVAYFRSQDKKLANLDAGDTARGDE